MLTVDFALPGVAINGIRLACAGNPVTLNVTGFEKPFAVGVIVIEIEAVAPAFTVTGDVGPASEKPSTVKAIDVGVGPPPGAGFVTVTLTVPAVDTSVAAIAAVTCVALTNVVGSAFVPKFTTEVATKFVPLTVNVKPVPPAA